MRWARYPYTGPSGYKCMPTVRSDERGPFGRNQDATHEGTTEIQQLIIAGELHK